ncbi:alpha/beta fold hydrolase, partial [Frankia sp. CiP3]|uniref:alpha/beta fold hydrolase n=1 Tax=Frankia sp. CiP3 TaxID=2880971 RepID=UPI001EF4009B
AESSPVSLPVSAPVPESSSLLIQAPVPVSAPDPGPAAVGSRFPIAWPVSGQTRPALQAQAARLAEFTTILGTRATVLGVARALTDARRAFPERAVVFGTDAGEFAAGLAGLAQGRSHPAVVTGGLPPGGRSRAGSGLLAAVFAGQGAQRAGMGRELSEAFPVFAEAFDEACAAFDPLLGRSLRETAYTGDGLTSTDLAQCALFAHEIALYRLAADLGLRPKVLVGHSLGEISAAHVADVLTLADAARLVEARGRLMSALPARGVMAAVEASAADVESTLSETTAPVGIAAVNSPTSVVVSGEADAVARVVRHFSGLGRRTKYLDVSHAFHSPLIEPMLEPFARVVAALRLREPRIPVVSLVTGRFATAAEYTDPGYWVRHAAAPVRFSDGIRSLQARGVRTAVEIGPDSVLSGLIDAHSKDDDPIVAVPLQRADRGQRHAVDLGLARLWCLGHGVRPSSLPAAPAAGHEVARLLPTYAFQHRRFWPDGTDPKDSPPPVTAGPAASQPPTARRRLVEAVRPEREALLRELIQTELAVVLGHDADGVDAHRPFGELGITSLTAAELRARLMEATGLTVAASAIFDHPTAVGLARHLLRDLGDETPARPEPDQDTTEPPPHPVAPPPPPSEAGPHPLESERYLAEPGPRSFATASDQALGPLTTLFREACAGGRAEAGIDLLAAAARLRAPAGAASAPPADPVSFSGAGSGPALICLPSLVAPASAYQYARFAGPLRGSRRVLALAPPGYTHDAALPADLETAVRVHADLIGAQGRPFALVGYSSGGWLAHAVAERLERDGVGPVALVLLDSYLPNDPSIAALQAQLYRELAANPRLVELVSDTSLVAMGHYLRLFQDWTPSTLAVPTLLAAAERFLDVQDDSRPVPDAAGAAAPIRPAEPTVIAKPWPTPHTRIVVRGTHSSMIAQFATDTAEAVDSWLRGLSQSPRPDTSVS